MKSILKSIAQWSPIPLTRNQLHDVQIKRVIQANLSPESNCIDVGCQEGKFFDFMVQSAPEGQHFGFEPIPDFFEDLKERYMFQSHCHISDIALSNEKTATHFNYVISNPAYSGFKRRKYDRKEERDVQLLVQTDLLDHIIPEHMSIDLIKIGVEGAELLVLEGARKIISRDKPLVIFQHVEGAANYYGATTEQIYEYFAGMNLEICTVASFLNGKSRLSKDDFCHHYKASLSDYFVAFSTD